MKSSVRNILKTTVGVISMSLALGIAVSPTATATAATTSNSTVQSNVKSWQRASWKAPKLVNPIVWTPSATNRQLSAPPDRDVLIKWPSTPIDVERGIGISGGRNIVSQGGTVKFSKRHFPASKDGGKSDPGSNNNRCLYIVGNTKTVQPRTIHIEGFHCAGQYIWEGINVDSRSERGSLTVQMRDVRVDGVNVDLPGGVGKHYGGDALQVWNGPHRLLIDGFTAKNLRYQGMFLQPYQFGNGRLAKWDMRNINLEGSSSGSAYLLWLAGSRSATASDGIDVTVKNVYVQPGKGRTRANTLWDANNDWKEVIDGRPSADFVKSTI